MVKNFHEFWKTDFPDTVRLLIKGSFKFQVDFSLIVSFAPHTLSSVADWPII